MKLPFFEKRRGPGRSVNPLISHLEVGQWVGNVRALDSKVRALTFSLIVR